MQDGGGDVTNVIHAVPGERLVKKGNSVMDWYFVKGRESRGILYILLGVHWIGFFGKLRVNKIRRFRYMKATGNEADRIGDFIVKSDDLTTKYVPFSGEQAIPVREAESADIFALDFIFNIIEECTFPVRSILKVADANTVLSSMVKKYVNTVTGSKTPDFFMKPGEASTEMLETAAEKSEDEARDQIGKTICSVTLISTSMPATDLALYEGPTKAKKEGEKRIKEAETAAEEKRRDAEGDRDATVTRAEGVYQAAMKQNEADKDRLERVLKPMAENDRTVAVSFADAYRHNEKVTVFAPGANSFIPLPLSEKKDTATTA